MARIRNLCPGILLDNVQRSMLVGYRNPHRCMEKHTLPSNDGNESRSRSQKLHCDNPDNLEPRPARKCMLEYMYHVEACVRVQLHGSALEGRRGPGTPRDGYPRHWSSYDR